MNTKRRTTNKPPEITVLTKVFKAAEIVALALFFEGIKIKSPIHKAPAASEAKFR